MALLYGSIYVGLTIINLRGSASEGRGDFGVLSHFALIALTALGLYFAVPKRIGQLRPLAALLGMAGLFLMILPFLSNDMAGRIFNGHPPLLGIGMAFFMPLGLFLFFRAAPTGSAVFSFALVMAGSELLWAFPSPADGCPRAVGPTLMGEKLP
jgi:hypothetical protein